MVREIREEETVLAISVEGAGKDYGGQTTEIFIIRYRFDDGVEEYEVMVTDLLGRPRTLALEGTLRAALWNIPPYLESGISFTHMLDEVEGE